MGVLTSTGHNCPGGQSCRRFRSRHYQHSPSSIPNSSPRCGFRTVTSGQGLAVCGSTGQWPCPAPCLIAVVAARIYTCDQW